LPPESDWFYYFDSQLQPQSQSAQSKVLTDLEQGIFIKAGSIIPEKIFTADQQSVLTIVKNPVLLKVYLNSSSQAHGAMYLDDGASFKNQESSEKTLIEFSFDGNVLKQKSLLKNDFIDSQISIGEIHFYGQTKPVTKVAKLNQEGQEVGTLPFGYDSKTSILTIKNVNIPLDDGDHSSSATVGVSLI